MIYEFAGHELDADRRELRADGEPVHVEPQVMDVLQYLIEHRDRLVTKMELLDEVWGDRFVSESALTSRIKSARAACGDSGRRQAVIRTIHGRGYRFVAAVAERSQGVGVGPVGGSPVAVSEVPGLVGRGAELSRLELGLSAAATGQRQAVFVIGEAGVGKSALLAEFLDRAEDANRWQVLRGQCLQSRSGAEAYFFLLDAWNRRARSEAGAVSELLYRVAPSWLAQIPTLVEPEMAAGLETRALGATARRMLLEGAEAVESLAGQSPVILAIEDLQWADEPSLEVLELLLSRSEPASLMVVATIRPEPGSGHDLVTAMTAAGRAAELYVQPLQPVAIDAMATEWFDGATVPEEVLETVRRRSEGVPLFAREMLTTWERAGQIERQAGAVELTVPIAELDTTVPDTVRQLIERDLATLDAADRELLEVAAVVGEEFDGATAAIALGGSLGAVEARLGAMSRQVRYLEALGGSRWIDGTVSTSFRFTHDLYRQIVHDGISAPRRADLHRAAGLALEQAHHGSTREVAVALSEHFVEAGDNARAADYLRQAGEQAAARSANAIAVEFFGRALRHVDRLPAGEERDCAELGVRISLGPALVATTGWFGAEVSENYERAMELAASRGTESEASLAAYGMATVTELRGEYARTEDLLVPLLEADVNEIMVETHELLACSMFHQGSFQHSLDNAESALAMDSADDPSTLMARMAEHPRAACNSWASLACWFLGRSDESLELADRAVEIAEHNLYALSTARVQKAFLHQFRGETAECAAWAESARELADAQGFPMRSAQAMILTGWAAALTGETASSLAEIEEGLAVFAALGARLTLPYFLGLRAEAVLHAGDPEQAEQILVEAVSTMTETTRSFFYEPELHRLGARIHLANAGPGAVESARRLLDRAGSVAEHVPPLALRVAIDRFELEDGAGSGESWRDELRQRVEFYAGQADTVDVTRGKVLLGEA